MKQRYPERTKGARAVLRLLHLRLCTLLAASLLAGCSVRVGSGDGKVIDFVSKEPIPQAAVELTCYVPRQWHGSDKKIRQTESASDGSYHFDPAGLQDCEFFFARATKAGYGLDHMTESMVNPGPETARRIPKITYLIKESDQPMVLLERLANLTPIDPIVAGPDAPFRFGLVYTQFIAAKRIATTPTMASWVREHYCAHLQAGWDVLSHQQRVKLQNDGSSMVDWSPISLRPDSFEREVRPYCGG